MARVSVIMSVYNEAEYLSPCLDSLLRQSDPDFEILCVDDGSTDDSLHILQAYREKDSRIKILRQSNQGAGVARNHGLAQAEGEYILFLDSDDYFDPGLIEKTVEKAERFQADIVVYRALSVDVRSGRTSALNERICHYSKYWERAFSGKDCPETLLNDFLVTAWNKLYRRSFLEQFHLRFQEIRRSNDLSFTCKTLVEARRIILLPETLVYYRTGNLQSLQSTNAATPFAFYEALEDLYAYLVERGHFRFFCASFYRLALSIVFYNINRLKATSAQRQVMEFLKEEGLRRLGFSRLTGLSISWIVVMQYKILVSSCSYSLKGKSLAVLYALEKIREYYQIGGFRQALEKIRATK